MLKVVSCVTSLQYVMECYVVFKLFGMISGGCNWLF